MPVINALLAAHLSFLKATLVCVWHAVRALQIVPATLAATGNPINVAQWAFINSCFSIGGLIGSYGVVVPLALLGRKKTLMLANIFVFISSACMYYGTVHPLPSIPCPLGFSLHLCSIDSAR